MWASFERAHPVLLGAIFDALSAALRNFDPMAPPPDFRLGDWAIYAVGVYRHAGWQGLAADLASIEHTRSEAVIDGSPVARAVLNLIKTRVGQAGPWEGTPRALYEACRAYADEAGELAIFPKAPNTFTARLREARRSLSEHGIRVESGRSDNRRWVRIGRDDGGRRSVP
jgi:putative DNA primase/helicase